MSSKSDSSDRSDESDAISTLAEWSGASRPRSNFFNTTGASRPRYSDLLEQAADTVVEGVAKMGIGKVGDFASAGGALYEAFLY